MYFHTYHTWQSPVQQRRLQQAVTSWASEWIFHETESSNWKVLLAQYPSGNSSVRVSPQAKTETPGQSITKGSSSPHSVPPPSDAATLLPCVIFPCTFPLLVLSIQELGSVLSISVHLPSSHQPPPTCSHLPQCQISSYSHTQANGSYTRSLQLDGTGAFCAIRSLWRSQSLWKLSQSLSDVTTCSSFVTFVWKYQTVWKGRDKRRLLMHQVRHTFILASFLYIHVCTTQALLTLTPVQP